ncbi:hypothetical protein ACF0H5_015788 [Mactra antiquata]
MKELVCIFTLYISLTGIHVASELCTGNCYFYTWKAWTAWAAWGSCSKTCGGGCQVRHRYCRYYDDSLSPSTCTDEQCCNRVCYNGGTWVDTDPSTCTGECSCKEGYIGECCQQECPSIQHCEAGQVECNLLSPRCNKCTPPYISTGWSGTCREPLI